MDLRAVLLRVSRSLDEARIRFALIGGLALSAHGAGRATVDLDFLAEGERDTDVHRILLADGCAGSLALGSGSGPRARPRILPALRPREGARRAALGARAMKVDADELRDLRADALSRVRSRDFVASKRAVERWVGEHPSDLDSTLAWIETLRRAFGDPPVDRRPCRGDEFRL